MANRENNHAFNERIKCFIKKEMLKEGMDVYLAKVENGEGIVVKKENKIHIEVKVHASSKEAQKGCSFGFGLQPFPKKRNYFFILYDERTNTKWIFSSKELDAEAETNKTGKNKGERSIILGERFEKYIATNFDRLKEYQGG